MVYALEMLMTLIPKQVKALPNENLPFSSPEEILNTNYSFEEYE